MKRVVMHVDRLVLRGLAPDQGRQLSVGLRDELARQLNEQAADASIGGVREVSKIDAGRAALTQGSNARTVGGALANAILRRLAP